MTDDLFRYTSGPHNADILIVGEAWDATEASERQPFVGESGKELTRILADAGIDRNDCLLTNVVSARPRRNDFKHFCYTTKEARAEGRPLVRGIYPRDELILGVQQLEELIAATKPRIIIALGNYPLWALTEDNFNIGNVKGYKVPTGIGKWRGSQLVSRMGIPLVPTYHPAGIMRMWSWRAAAVHDLRVRVPALNSAGMWDYPEYHFTIRPTYVQVIEKIIGLNETATHRKLWLSVDIETRLRHTACIGLAWNKLEAICIPFMCTENIEGYWTEQEEISITQALCDLLRHPNVEVIGQNFLYDAQYLIRHWGLRVPIAFDTLVTQHLLWPGAPKGLDYLSSMYCTYHTYWKDEGKNWDPKMGEDQLWEYNCKDACITFEVKKEMELLVQTLGLTQQFKWEHEQLELMLDMMLKGVAIDRKERMAMQFDLDAAIQSRHAWLEEVIPWGDELKEIMANPKTAKAWYNSPKQTMHFFYDQLGQKEIRNRKTGQPTVDDAALETIAKREPLLEPVVQCLQELRSCGIFSANFLGAKLDIDNRMRCSYNVHPETFRWSSSKSAFDTGTNLQTIPEGTED